MLNQSKSGDQMQHGHRGATTFAERAAAIQLSDRLEDPQELRDLLISRGDDISASELRVLWETAAAQKAQGEVLIADGDANPQSAERLLAWSSSESVLNSALRANVKSDELSQALHDWYVGQRGSRALPLLAPRIRRLESLLNRQQAIFHFHYTDDGSNDYKLQEQRLSAIVAAIETAHADRVETAKAIVTANQRYKSIIFNRLTPLSSEVESTFEKCRPLVEVCDAALFPELHRWRELTSQVVLSRKKAALHLATSLELDTVIPNDVLSRPIPAKEGEELCLSQEASDEMRSLGASLLDLLDAGVRVELRIKEERQSLVEKLVPSSEIEKAKPDGDSRITRVTRHPIERKAWFRAGKVVWWTSIASGCLLAGVIAPSLGEFVGASLVVVAIMLGLRSLFYYIALGRPTLFEKPNSEFVDLEVLEQTLIEAGNEVDSSKFENLRSRFGSRVPRQAMRAFIETQMSKSKAKKQEVLREADRTGSTVSIESLRDRLEGSASEVSSAWIESWLLRLEVKHGATIPISIADAELDALMP